MNRYARQQLYREIGSAGQAGIASSSIAVVGVGALGCQAAAILARAGVGELRLIDRDLVEITNLQRQVLYTEHDAATEAPKASAARRHLLAANSAIDIVAHDVHLAADNIDEVLAGVTVVVDGTDNFEVRYLLNDWAVRAAVPWIYAAAIGASGLLMPVIPGETACLRCVFEDLPPAGSADTCDTAGVLGSTTSTVGALAALEALKVAAGRRDAVRHGLLQLDLWGNDLRAVDIAGPRPDCPCCGARQFPFLEATDRATTALCGRDAIQVSPPRRLGFPFDQVKARIIAATHVEDRGILIRFAVDDIGVTLFRDGRAILRGTDDPLRARTIYDRFIGS